MRACERLRGALRWREQPVSGTVESDGTPAGYPGAPHVVSCGRPAGPGEVRHFGASGRSRRRRRGPAPTSSAGRGHRIWATMHCEWVTQVLSCRRCPIATPRSGRRPSCSAGPMMPAYPQDPGIAEPSTGARSDPLPTCSSAGSALACRRRAGTGQGHSPTWLILTGNTRRISRASPRASSRKGSSCDVARLRLWRHREEGRRWRRHARRGRHLDRDARRHSREGGEVPDVRIHAIAAFGLRARAAASSR